ncbi:MFS transporter [Microbacterium hydrocarbonoxydans]|uniref:Predicted arabinose efflux permease, MFS family n=1 Tax=Microbacterium hydrocarbonoxydans TaxID=273678 RepID=A0A1H4KRD5_9MICO|nr:MFS transporter [Microbacterium hydrocarbonoxydans]SEB61109.1 Predicted arabinose efflux permease, MFS family [Microbacterium hydrocarbonoxydans]
MSVNKAKIPMYVGKDGRELRRVLTSSYVGSMIEYYDFVLYAAASGLIFNRLFFNDLPPAVATIAAFATLAVGFVVRPLGAIIFGYFGDRVGRKSVLVITMTMMGVATALMAVLPTRDQAGVIAPILLIILRVVQGLSVGGEWGGAALMAFEHAHPKRRGFAAVFATAGQPSGSLLAGVVLALFALMPEEHFLSWGWRVPFALSAVLVIFGLWIRIRVSESPLFLEEKRRREQSTEKTRSPLIEVLHRPGTLVLAFVALLAPFLSFTLSGAFGITYGATHGLSTSSVLFISSAGSLVCIVGELFFASLSDRVGRRPVMIGGVIAGALLVFPFFLLLQTGTAWGALLAFALINGVAIGATFGPLAAFMGERFSTGSRFTGLSLGYQLAATVGGGFGPLILTALIASNPADITPIVWFIAGVAVLSIVALFFSRDRAVEAPVVDETTPAVAESVA